MKNTWVYNELERFLEDPPIKVGDVKNGTLIILINSLIIPIFAICVLFLVVILTIPYLLLSIIKDIYDVWYKYNEERLKTNFLKDVNKNLINYGNKLLKKEGLYKFKNYEIKTNNIPLNMFIKNFFIDYNYSYNTVNKRNKVICTTGRRRSLGDIYLICKHYYPNCTIIEVFKELVALLNLGNINTQKCSDIRKYVFYSNRASSHRSLYNCVEYFNVQITMSELISKIK